MEAGQKYSFHFGTEAAYKALVEKDANAFYCLTDSKQIYIGSDLYSGTVTFVEENFPETPSQGTIYVNTATHETKVWNGTSWNTIVPPILDAAGYEAGDDSALVSKGALEAYVSSETTGGITNITYDKDTQKFTVEHKDAENTDIQLENLVTNIEYVADTAELKFTLAGAKPTTKVLNLPKENFLSSASYDGDTHELTLTLNDATEVKVNLEELIDVYVGDETSKTTTVKVEGNKIGVEVKASAEPENAVELKEDGVFVQKISVEDGQDIGLSIEAGKITATAKLSADEAKTNYLTKGADGGLLVDLSASHYTKTEVDELLSWKAIASA